MSSVVHDLFAEAGLDVPIAHEVAETSTLVTFVAAGLGVAVVPEPTSDLKVPGVVSAKRFHVESQETVDIVDAPTWTSMALYEIESEDPEAVLAEILARARTDAMPVTDAMSRPGLVKVLSTLSRAIEKD